MNIEALNFIEGRIPQDKNDSAGAENWARVVELVQTAFREGELAEESTWQPLVLITKGKKDYRGIGLVEVMWKVVAVILNRRFTSSITYNDALHGFRAGSGTGTATLEDKLIQQLAAMREEVLYVIFLDLTKAYGTLDRSRCLEILEGYCVGPSARRLLKNTGAALPWWPGRAGTTAKLSKGRGGSRRATRCPPPSLMCWWMRSSDTG